MSKYDYLIVGAGLFGAVAAYRAARSGKKALVIDRRPHRIEGDHVWYIHYCC